MEPTVLVWWQQAHKRGTRTVSAQDQRVRKLLWQHLRVAECICQLCNRLRHAGPEALKEGRKLVCSHGAAIRVV